MTKKQRVFAAINRTTSDATPWQFDLTSAVKDKLKAYYHTDDLLEATGDHVVYVGPNNPAGLVIEQPGPDIIRNEFGSEWRRSARDSSYGDWGELLSYPLPEPSLEGYSFPDGSLSGRWETVSKIRDQYPDHFLIATGHGLFESAWGLCGFENYLGYLMGEQDFVHELTDKLADYSCKVTKQLKELGVDGIRFGDDWGFQDRLMVRAEVWRDLYKKAYAEIFAAARDAGAVVMMHSCGNLTEIIPDLIEIGLQVLHPLQPEAIDVRKCQVEFGKDITFWGGLGSQSTIPHGTPEDNRREVLDMLEVFRDGGYILAPAGAIPTEAPVENVVAIIEAAKEQIIG